MSELPQITTLRAAHSIQSTQPRGRRRFRFNPVLFVVVALLAAYGLLICWSATTSDPDYSFSRQALCVAAGAVIMVAMWHFDYQRLANMHMPFLIVTVVLILSPHLPVIGVERMGAQSWINVGMQLQPGEFAKVTLVIFAASLVARYGGVLDDVREYLKCLVLLVIPFLCIMTQPDLGTGLVYLIIAASVLIVGGAKARYLVGTLLAGIGLVALLLFIDEFFLKYQTASGDWEYRILKQYQRDRLLVFLDPEADLAGDGYNLAQAKIAIGSGGLFGKGLMNGTQSAYHLPEAPTDFVFCILAEELGFVGSMVLIGLYIALMVVIFRIARRSVDLFGTLIVSAIIGMWLFQILENIGMTVGLMPITGIPLPFVSYGSSFMIVNFIMLGLIGSVWAQSAMTGKKGGYATPR